QPGRQLAGTSAAVSPAAGTVVAVVLDEVAKVVTVVVVLDGGTVLLEQAERRARTTNAIRRCITVTVLPVVLLAACGTASPRFNVATVSTVTTSTTTVTTRALAPPTTTPRVTAKAPRPSTIVVPQLAHVSGSQAIVVTTKDTAATAATVT